MEKETIELANATPSNIGDFTNVIPHDTPRYSFFIFKHTHEGVDYAPLGIQFPWYSLNALADVFQSLSTPARLIARSRSACCTLLAVPVLFRPPRRSAASRLIRRLDFVLFVCEYF